MSLEKKLLSKYIPENEIEQIYEERRTSLRRYIQMIGLNWKTMSQEQINKIADSEAYKQFKGFRKIRSHQNLVGIREGVHGTKTIKNKSIPSMNNMKEVEPEDESQCEKEFEITKTLSGEKKETNTIQINPTMKIIRKSDEDKKKKDNKKDD